MSSGAGAGLERMNANQSLWPRLAELPLVIEGYELDGLTAELAGGMMRADDPDPAAGRGSRRARRGHLRPSPTTLTPFATPRRRCPWRATGRSGASPTTSPRSTSGRRRRSGRRRSSTATGPSSRPRSTSRCARPAARCTRCSSASRARSPSSTRSGSATRPSTETIHRRLANHPDVHFKLDAAAAWTLAVCEDLAATGAVEVVDFKGQYGIEVEDAAGPGRHVRARGRDVPRRHPRGPSRPARDLRAWWPRTPAGSPTTR